MSVRTVLKNVIFIVAVLAFIAGGVFVLIKIVPKPPRDEVQYARMALSTAVSSNADTYSKNLYREAKALYDSAFVNWQKENKRFIYFRRYDKVKKFAELSARKAEQAAKVSKNNMSDLNTKIRQKIESLNKLDAKINKLFPSYPLSSDVRNHISKGEMLLKEAEVAYKKGQFFQANKKITDSEHLLTTSYDIASTSLKDYFNQYPVWKRWAEKTIKDSQQNQCYSIIIDKYSRKCIVYFAGAKKFEYTIELGRNWVGDKLVKGDKATPEGMYRIIKKFGSNKTKYHKALLLDYPNDADRAEFKQAIAKGILSRSAKIGGLIEIHGDGGRGVDWTEGCVALMDSEMDIIYKIAGEGTPVTIIGSMVNLDQLID